MNAALKPMQLLVTVSAVSVLVLAPTARPAGAVDEPDRSVYAELAELNPGTTSGEMRDEAEGAAAETGESVDQVARDALDEAQLNAKRQEPNGSSASSSGGGGKGERLPDAVAGDIFWWDSTTDHVGLYYRRAKVVHAPGVGKTVQVVVAGELPAPKHTELMLVNTQNDGSKRIGEGVRIDAADWAKTKEGKPYNKNFAFNKKINASKYNCSQLVWAAWKVAKDIDLDNGPSKGVYPGDIRGDRRTHVYRNSI